MTKMKWKVFSLVAAATLFIAPAAFAAKSTVVTISNFTFNPPEIEVHVGDTVVFHNGDDIPHLVVADDKSFRTAALDTGDEAPVTFTKAGSFPYFCGLHPHMQGKVTVVP
jgi:plastocyanin